MGQFGLETGRSVVSAVEQSTLPVPAPHGAASLAAPGSFYAPAPQASVTVNVGAPTMVFTHHKTGPGFFIRALWFLFIGWWASGLAIFLGYLAVFSIIGLPLAFFIFNRLPTILTLRARTQEYSSSFRNGVTHMSLATVAQRAWWQRAIYFAVVGWWFGAVWLTLAWLVGILLITMPLSFWMYNRVSGVMTLQRH